MPSSSIDPRLARAYRLILALAGTSLGLFLVVAYLLWRPAEGGSAVAALADPEVRQEAIARIVAGSPGFYDSHVDAEVGRVNLLNLDEREWNKTLISTNRFGMRERDYELPKPAGMIRIVILGDSMVFGLGSPAADRMGVHLEAWLAERVPEFAGRIECLHFGVPSWNLVAETTWLRRQLSELDPDLAFHLIVPNDLDDGAGTRGFGAQAEFSPRYRHRADSLIGSGFPVRVLGSKKVNYLRLGLDWESQHRYREAGQRLRTLAAEVERGGGRYRLLVHFRKLLPVAHQQLTRHLEPAQVVYMSNSFGSDRSYTLSKRDPHWNREGHRVVARLLYGLIVRDALLPDLDPPPWEEAAEAVRDIADGGRNEAERPLDTTETLALYRSPRITSRLDFTALDTQAMSQINGGLDPERLVSPYASFFLKNAGTRLRIEGQALPRPELDGATVRVLADAEFLGTFEIQANQQINQTFTRPGSLAARPYLSIRFEADDYVYHGPNLQHCVVFRLDRLVLEP